MTFTRLCTTSPNHLSLMNKRNVVCVFRRSAVQVETTTKGLKAQDRSLVDERLEYMNHEGT